MEQTAVNYLVEQLLLKALTEEQYYHIQRAKDIEEQQIIDAYKEGMGNVDGWIVDENGAEDYYIETFKK